MPELKRPRQAGQRVHRPKEAARAQVGRVFHAQTDICTLVTDFLFFHEKLQIQILMWTVFMLAQMNKIQSNTKMPLVLDQALTKIRNEIPCLNHR